MSNIHIDDNLREKFQFNDASFPFDIDVDCYKDFPSATLPLHWHDFVEFDCVLSGTVSFTVNSEAFSVRQTACMKEMLAYIHNTYKSSIKIDELASHAGISRAECFRCFKRYTGKTPIEYLNDYRLSQAANMLITTELSAVEIGLACGFESQSYFGKLFKDLSFFCKADRIYSFRLSTCGGSGSSWKIRSAT